MNSPWMREVAAVLGKEWRTEWRSRHGLFTSLLFILLASLASGLAASFHRPSPGLAAGMLVVTLLFAAVVALPRSFLIEDEQGTFDLLRLLAQPTTAFVGKALFGALQMVGSAVVVAVLFVNLTGVDVLRPGLFALALILEALALSGGVALCSALVLGASNRWVLAGAAAIPILAPQVFLAVGALRVALGEGSLMGGWQSVVGLAGFALVLLAGGPLLVQAVWSVDESPPAQGDSIRMSPGE